MMDNGGFSFMDERFADLQILRYEVKAFSQLNFRQKMLVYSLAQATLYGRDITFDQQGKYNLRIRQLLEAVYALLLMGTIQRKETTRRKTRNGRHSSPT